MTKRAGKRGADCARLTLSACCLRRGVLHLLRSDNGGDDNRIDYPSVISPSTLKQPLFLSSAFVSAQFAKPFRLSVNFANAASLHAFATKDAFDNVQRAFRAPPANRSEDAGQARDAPSDDHDMMPRRHSMLHIQRLAYGFCAVTAALSSNRYAPLITKKKIV